MDGKSRTDIQFLAGGGEMGRRIREFNWAATSLGSPENWSQSLKTCVRIMLSSQQPIWIGWGTELIKLYNDAYIDIVRGKHPIALGQPASVVWKDIWKDIEPLLSKAMLADEGTYVEAQLLIMHRSGFPEETYYTFSYTPVLGDDGKPAGIICYNTADTERIINERALKTLQQLDTLLQKKSEDEVYEQAVKALEFNKRDLPFAIIYKLAKDGKSVNLVAPPGIEKDYPELPLNIKLHDPVSNFKNIARAVATNKIVESANNGRWKNLPRGDWEIMPENYVHVPIRSANNKMPLAILTVGLNPHRKLDDAYRNFIQQVAGQVSLSVNNLLSHKKIEENEKELQELVKQAPVAIVLLEGAELVARVANATALKLMGKDEKEVINKPMQQYFPDLPERENTYRQVLNTGIPYTGKEVEVKFKRLGEAYTGYYDLNYTPWYSSDGSIKGVMSVGVEVTEKVLARKKVEESEKQFRTLTESLPQLVWMTDEKGTQLYASGRWEEYTGIFPSGIETWQQIVHADDLPVIESSWSESILTGKNYQAEKPALNTVPAITAGISCRVSPSVTVMSR